MRGLLRLAHAMDRLSERVGRAVMWLVLVAVLVSAGNAIVRYTWHTSSNAWLELQWYLYAAVFLLCAGYTLLRNEHVRIDILTGRLSARARAAIDILGGLLFLLPMAILIGVLSWPVLVDSWMRGEVSPDAGGLIRWPAKALIPLGFLLLALQALSEIVKRIAFLRGAGPDPAGARNAPHGAGDPGATA